MKRSILIFLLFAFATLINAQCDVRPQLGKVTELGTSDGLTGFTVGIYREGYPADTCFNPDCPNSVNINLLPASFDCNNLPTGDFIEQVNGTDFNFGPFLGTVLNPDDCMFQRFQQNIDTLIGLDLSSNAIRINLIEGDFGAIPPNCTIPSCPTETTVTINVVAENICLDACEACQVTEAPEPTNTLFGFVGETIDLSVETCLNTEALSNAGVCPPFDEWTLAASISVRPNTPKGGEATTTSNSTIYINSTSSGQFTFTPEAPGVYLIDYVAQNSASGDVVPLQISQTIAIRSSRGTLTSGKCAGFDCCKLVVDCITAFRLAHEDESGMDIGSIWQNGNDLLCPFPICGWDYMFDERAELCIGSSNTQLTHEPYTSLSTCASDVHRAPREYCLEPLTKAYRICKHSAGLL